MKKTLIFLVVLAFIVTGCAASTLSSRSLDGVTLTLKNYVVTETTTYDAAGKVVQIQKMMVPDKSIIEGSMDKIMAALKSLIGIANVPVAAVKTSVPAITK